MLLAYTSHQEQGLSLAEDAVRFELEKQIYVALSKISSINKMYLIGS